VCNRTRGGSLVLYRNLTFATTAPRLIRLSRLEGQHMGIRLSFVDKSHQILMTSWHNTKASWNEGIKDETGYGVLRDHGQYEMTRRLIQSETQRQNCRVDHVCISSLLRQAGVARTNGQRYRKSLPCVTSHSLYSERSRSRM
jgi:hypothetical protein